MPTLEEMKRKVESHFKLVLGGAYKGLNDTGKRIAQQRSAIDKAEIDRRLKICNTNVCGEFDAVNGGTCRLCKCAAQLATAIRLKHCPKGLW